MSDKDQWHRNIYNTIDKKTNSTLHIAEGYVEAVNKAKKKVKIKLLPDLEDVGWVRLYMLGLDGNVSSGVMPAVGNNVLILFPRGDRENGICLAGGMSEADENGSEIDSELDITLHDKHGNKITMKSGAIEIQSQTLKYNNGTSPVARVGDYVASPFGNLPIITGNNNFLA